jgi:hypothetical protein
VSIGGRELDVFDFLLFLDALFDETNLADIGSLDDVLYVRRLASLDDAAQLQYSASSACGRDRIR